MKREPIYRFGDYEVDVDNELLTLRGRTLPIQALPFRVLVCLVSRAGELVRRQELIREIWGDSYVDAERGLNTAIKKVRLALGEPGSGRIQTVRGRGYRFRGPVARSRFRGLALLNSARSYPMWTRAAVVASVVAVPIVAGLLAVGLPSRPVAPTEEVVESGLTAETCEYENTLRIAVEPLWSEGEAGTMPRLGRALADDIAGALWSVDERRLAAIRTWEPDADLSGIDYVLNGQIRLASPSIVLELELTPTQTSRREWRGIILLPENEPFLLPDRVNDLVEHLTSAEA